MNILFAASELEPFASTGSFGAAMLSLTGELRARGHEVSIVLPYYRCVREGAVVKSKKTGAKFTVPVGGSRFSCEVRECRAPNGVQVFFIERDEYFDRSGLYGTDGRDYQDNSARFAFFCRCVVEVARRMEPAPDVVHAHNWQAALVPVLLAEQRLPFRRVLSAHTLEFQGNFWSYDFGLTSLPGEYFSARGLEYYGSLNYLKGGMLFADSVVLPGPRMVSEAQTPEHGCGLDPVLREQAWKLEGIQQGIDYSAWTPATDKALAKRFKSPEARRGNRKPWLARNGLTPPDGAPVFLVVTESMESDGMDLLVPALDRVVESGARVVVLGKVAAAQCAAMGWASRRHAGRLSWIVDTDETTLRQGLAGSDAMIFPAAVRPDARVLLLGLRYGAIPVSVACGGLELLVSAWNAADETGLGFYCYRSEPDALVDAIRRAASLFGAGAAWDGLVSRAMAADFSWAAAAEKTERLYASLIARLGPARAA